MVSAVTDNTSLPRARAKVVLLGPALGAVSGVSTHLNMLFASSLARSFELLQFQVGTEGRRESALRRLLRLMVSPVQLAYYLLRQQPAIVHINTSMDSKAYWRDLAYLVIAKLMRRRVVYQVHGGALPADFFATSPTLSCLLRWALRLTDAVLVLSHEELAAYKAFAPGLVVRLVPNAIDPVGLVDQPRSYNTSAPLRLVFIGRLVRVKGLFEIVEALAQLKSEGLRFELAFAGDGPDRLALEAFVQQRGIGKQTRMLGGVFGPAKTSLWLESDVFLFPTYHAEGLPYAILEAMAGGCVAVAAPVAAIADVVENGVNGLFVKSQDAVALASAVRALDSDRQLLRQLGDAGRARIADYYTLPRLADDIGRIYRLILAGS